MKTGQGRMTGKWRRCMTTIFLGIAMMMVDAEGQEEATAEQASMTERVTAASAKQFDEEFLKHMTLHHIDAIKLGELARFHSQNEELKTAVDQMRNKQQEQMAQMLDWLSLRYNEQPQPLSADDPLKKKLTRQMDGLRTFEGAEFDRKFIDAITEHHESAVEMSKIGTGRAQNEDVRELARKIEQGHTEEIQKLQKIESLSDEKPEKTPRE